MAAIRYTLGLDIGITSVGWAVLRNDKDGEPKRIQDLGVRTFDAAEQSKGASLAAPRREARGARRRLRRHRHRLERIRWLMEQSGIMPAAAIEAMYAEGGFTVSPYELRAAALDRLLTKEELVRVLIHLAQRRGYQSNSRAQETQDDKETGKVKSAIAENRQRMEANGYCTVGEMMFRDEAFWSANPDGTRYHQTRNKAGEYRLTVERALIIDEARQICAAQRGFGADWLSEAVEADYLAILASQRSFDEGPGGDSPYRDGLANMVGFCTYEPEECRAPKASYTFEYFKLLQNLNHMRLASRDMAPQPLNAGQREILKRAALETPNLTYAGIREKLGLGDEVYFNSLYYGSRSRDEAEKQKWPQMQSYHVIRKALKDAGQEMPAPPQMDVIAGILTLRKNDDRRMAELRETGIPEEMAAALLPLNFQKYGSLSLKAMQKLIPLLEQGMRYDEASKAVYGDRRGAEKKARLSLNDMEEITNPVVRRAISQTIKVINAIVRTYGPPEAVRVELARELKQTFEERKKTENRQNKNREANETAREEVEKDKGSRATGLDIVKYKLWKEQDGVCPYSGKNLDRSRLYEPGYAEVDHIIPYSRCFDDSYQNKVVVLGSENRQKGNRLPYEYFGHDEARWSAFEARVARLNYRKRQKLLKQTFTEAESEDFTARNLSDTQYIATTVLNFLRNHLLLAETASGKEAVQAVNGAVTAMLRGRWGLQKIREDGDLHHCMDAVVIAATSPGLRQSVTKYSQNRENGTRSGDSAFPEPWPRFRQELEARLDPVDPRQRIDQLHLSNYESDEEIKPVFVSQMPKRKTTGAAHDATIRSSKMGEGYAVSKVALTDLEIDKTTGEIKNYYNPGSDKLLYDALLAQLRKFDGDGKKAFAQPFYKPKRDGTPGPRVDKVKVYQKVSLGQSVRGGIAKNNSMVRIDVFHVAGDGYYFVPIYVADTIKDRLPSKAVVADKSYADWKEMRDEDFLFSLYPKDLIRIRKKGGIKLRLANSEATGEKEILRQDAMLYYVGANIAGGKITVETHDGRYVDTTGVKRLLSIEKYQVDVLGNYTKVKLPEKRVPFSKRRKKG